ncbi:MAG: SdpI family protein [Blautia sp.]|nr:SdpI family protein [Blautia sp.]
MLKEEKKLILITSILTLLPMFLGLLLWSRLPDQMPTHWNGAGEIDGWHSRLFAVCFLPLFILAMHLIGVFATLNDPKKRNISPKVFRLVLWICPAVAVYVAALIYPTALGYAVNTEFMVGLLMGALFIIAGNYLPKCRPNYTIGIRIRWTIDDEENWNRTHRLAGPLWVAGGFVILLTTFLHVQQFPVMLAVLILLSVIPILYSYLFYLKKKDS